VDKDRPADPGDLETLIAAGLVRAIRPMTKNQLTNATRALPKSAP
jgi:hypothetical protein